MRAAKSTRARLAASSTCTLDALEKAYDERSWFLTYLNTAPEFDFLRSEPRFQALVRKMKFPA
jgi:hypothetical protein